jgi:hypothetical protein
MAATMQLKASQKITLAELQKSPKIAFGNVSTKARINPIFWRGLH